MLPVAIAGYGLLVGAALLTGNDLLCALCAVVLVSVVLGRALRAGRFAAWLGWCAMVGGIGWLTWLGQGRLTLDVLPIAINLALAALFGHTLLAGRTPLVARAIIVIEGRDRLALPRVAGYATALTATWTALFLVQAGLFIVLLAWVLPQAIAHGEARPLALAYLHFGGYLVPVCFMLIEYGFRRWYLRHVPHVSMLQFAQRLVRNWHGLLRDGEPINPVH